MSYDNTNRGSIWPNQKKEKDTHPDFTGSLNVNGVEFWVSAWKRKPDANPKSPSLSFSVKPKDEQQSAPSGQQSGQQSDYAKSGGSQPEDFGDDIPF